MAIEGSIQVLELSALEMAEAVRSREVSSEELVLAHLDQIDRLQGVVNAFGTVDRDGAVEAARRADATPDQAREGRPLFGVPCSIKDNIGVGGLPLTIGNVSMREFVCPGDDVLVERLKAAGAVILGKTNLPDLGLAYETDNHVFGRTNNPYDLERTPGGSSGGEAAAISSGCSPLGIGNDAWGSIRQPAHCVGIAGLKPTPGRVPILAGINTLVLPVHGPMARTVVDVSLAFSVLAGQHWSDPLSAPVPVVDPASVRVDQLRVAVVEQIGPQGATPETSDALRRSAEALEAAGASVAWVDSIPGNDQIEEYAIAGLDAASGAGTELRLAGLGSSLEKLHPLTRLTYDLVAKHSWTVESYQDTLSGILALRVKVRRFFGDHDVLLSPVAAEPAARHGEAWGGRRGVDYCRWHNITGVPAATVRAGTSPEGLPINIQAASRPFAEHDCLAAVGIIEEQTGGWVPPALFAQ